MHRQVMSVAGDLGFMGAWCGTGRLRVEVGGQGKRCVAMQLRGHDSILASRF